MIKTRDLLIVTVEELAKNPDIIASIHTSITRGLDLSCESSQSPEDIGTEIDRFISQSVELLESTRIDLDNLQEGYREQVREHLMAYATHKLCSKFGPEVAHSLQIDGL